MAFETTLLRFQKKLERKPAAFETMVNFFSLRKKVAKKGKNPCRIYRAVSVQGVAEKRAPLPAVMFASFLANIRRNREAWERFTDSLCSAKRAIGANVN